jgi:hypothetical protein
VFHMDPCPRPAPRQVADATGYPLAPPILRQANTL